MHQPNLFEIDREKRQEILLAIQNLQFGRAKELAAEYQRLPARSVELSWEVEVIAFGARLEKKRLDLDAGSELWREFESQPFFPRIPLYFQKAIREKFFSRLLALNRGLFDLEELRTRKGQYIGSFYLHAGQPTSAVRFLERARKMFGEDWQVRLDLGNGNFCRQAFKAARANYLRAFLLGLTDSDLDRIQDFELVEVLHQAEEPEWAFAEACLGGCFSPARFSNLIDFDEFRTLFLGRLSREAVSAPREFCIWWIMSENALFCDSDLKQRARKRLKALHPRLHSQYMRSLEKHGK